jgi:hypothetical protein
MIRTKLVRADFIGSTLKGADLRTGTRGLP